MNTTATVQQLVVRKNGFSLASAAADLPDIKIGSFLSASSPKLTFNNVGYAVGGNLTGTLGLQARQAALFPGQTSVNVSITDGPDADDLALIGSFNLATSAFSLGIDQFSLAVSQALKLSASGATISYNPNRSEAQAILTLSSASLNSPQFDQLGSVNVSGLTIRTDGFSFDGIQWSQKAGQTVRLGSIFEFSGLAIAVKNFSFTFGQASVLNGQITVQAASAKLFPDNTTFSATVTSFSGGFDFTNNQPGTLALSAGSFEFQFGQMLSLTAKNLNFAPNSDVMASIASISVSLPGLKASGTVSGLQIAKNGEVSVVSAAIQTQGLAQTLGLGNFLPFDLTEARINFLGDINHNGQRDPGEVFRLNDFDLTVGGHFNFTLLKSLPFTPIIRIGASGSQTSLSSANDTFSFTLRSVNGELRPWNLGPIEIGFADLKIGQTVTLGGSIKLGGYQNGIWASTFGGSISISATNQMKDITGSAAVSIQGTFDAASRTIDISASLTISFKLKEMLEVTNAQLNFAMVLKADANYAYRLDKLQLGSASVGSVKIVFGSLLTLEATQASFNFNPSSGQDIAQFGSLTATLTSLGIGGTAKNLAIGADGSLKVLGGAKQPEVSLSLSDSGKLKWPSWLPIKISQLSIAWKDFNADKLDFTLSLSASVTGLQNLPVQVSGGVEGVKIDVGLLKAGQFPITDIGSFSVSIKGNLFGGTVEGAIILGIVKVDASGKQIAATDQTTPVSRRIFFGAIQAGMSFAGLSGFQIRIGLSELGPLQIYVGVNVPVLLEPISGLTIGNFHAGVTFNSSLPSITDPLDLRKGDFKPAAEMTLEEWRVVLEKAVVSQAQGGAGWNVFSQPMKIEGGASLYSAYTSSASFRADIDIIISTDGKFLINAKAVFANSVNLNMKLYADLTKVAQGNATILFLADLPGDSPKLTFRGGITFLYQRLDGKPVDATHPADVFRIKINGAVDLNLVPAVQATLQGSVEMAFSSGAIDLDIQASLNVSFLGDLIGAAGKFHINTSPGQFELYGGLVLAPNFGFLEKVGLVVTGSAVLRINTTSRLINLSLNVPGTGNINMDLPAGSFSVLVQGMLKFKQGGTDWFLMSGKFALEITGTGLDVYVDAKVMIGPSAKPFLSLSGLGFLQIKADGIAAKIMLSLDTNLPPEMGLVLSGQFLLLLNTTSKDVSYTIPSGFDAVEGSRTVSLPGSPPGSSQAAPYLAVNVTGQLKILNAFVLEGSFKLLASPAVIKVEAKATMDLTVQTTKILSFNIAGGFQIDAAGVALALELSLQAGIPSKLGFSFDARFWLRVNTRKQAVNLAGINLPAGPYATVFASGSLSVGGFALSGTFFLSFASDHFEVSLTVNLSVFGASLGLEGAFGIYSDGMALKLALKADLIQTSFMTLKGSFGLEINTSNRTLLGVDRNTCRVYVSNANVTILGFTLSGSISIGFRNGKFEINIPISDPLRINLFGLAEFRFAGYIRSDGQFLINASAWISIGIPSVLQIGANLYVEIKNSGFWGSLDGSLTLFNQNVAHIGGSLTATDGTFALTVNASFSLFGFISVNGNFSLKRYASGLVETSFSGTASIWGFFNASVNGNIRSDGVWRVYGHAYAGINLWVVGASISLDFDVGNDRWSFTISGNAWANILLAAAEGWFSASVNSSGRADVTVGATFRFLWCSWEGSFTIHIDFNGGGRIWLSDIAGATVFLDLNNNEQLDPGEIFTIADDNGYYSFAEPLPMVDAGSRPLTPFERLDRNHNGILDAEDGRFLLIRGVSSDNHEPYAEALDLPEGVLSGSTDLPGRTVFFDVNNNRLPDAGELVTTTDPQGFYDFTPLLLPAVGTSSGNGQSTTVPIDDSAGLLGSMKRFDANGNGKLDSEEGSLLVIGGVIPGTQQSNTRVIPLSNNALTGYSPVPGAMVFFDVNKNQKLDPGEANVRCDKSGFYNLAAVEFQTNLGRLAKFDTNHNGLIDPEEGKLVVVGGHDINTGQANTQVATATAENLGTGMSQTVSPLTTLQQKLVESGFSYREANDKITTAFGLPMTTNIGNLDPRGLDKSSNVGDAAQAAATQCTLLTTVGAEILYNSNPTQPHSNTSSSQPVLNGNQAREALWDGLVAELSRIEPNRQSPVDDHGNFRTSIGEDAELLGCLNLGDAAVLNRILNNASDTVDCEISAVVTDSTATVIAENNRRITTLVGEGVENINIALATIKALTFTDLRDATAQMARGELEPEDFVRQNTGSSLAEKVRSVHIVASGHTPFITEVPDLAIADEVEMTSFFLQVSDPDGLSDDLVLTAVSDNADLLPEGSIQISGTGRNRLLKVTPADGFAGRATVTITVDDGKDHRKRAQESFVLNVVPGLEIFEQTVVEPDSGSVVMAVKVELTAVSNLTEQVSFSTQDVTALAGVDYVATSGTLEFAPGETLKIVKIHILGDKIPESNKVFDLLLQSAMGGETRQGVAVINLIDNDPPFPINPLPAYDGSKPPQWSGSADLNFPFSFGISSFGEIASRKLISKSNLQKPLAWDRLLTLKGLSH